LPVDKNGEKKLYTSSASSNVMEGNAVGLNLRGNYKEWNYRPASLEGKNMKGQREKGSLPKKHEHKGKFQAKTKLWGEERGPKS
jgi:hypothetical protein